MDFTAELGTRNSMPGNIALGTLPPTGSPGTVGATVVATASVGATAGPRDSVGVGSVLVGGVGAEHE